MRWPVAGTTVNAEPVPVRNGLCQRTRGRGGQLGAVDLGRPSPCLARLHNRRRAAAGRRVRSGDRAAAPGIALSVSAQLDEVLLALDRALELNPADVQAHGYRACSLAGLGYYDEALGAVRSALALKPGYTLTLEQRALVQERMRATTASGVAVSRRRLDGDDPMSGPALRAFEGRIGTWALNREAVTRYGSAARRPSRPCSTSDRAPATSCTTRTARSSRSSTTPSHDAWSSASLASPASTGAT